MGRTGNRVDELQRGRDAYARRAWLEANERLERQNGMVASFSRALSEGLSARQTDEEFNAVLDESIASIFAASKT